MIQSSAFSLLEEAINRYLQLDPKTTAHLATISGKSIKLVIMDWNFSLFILPHPEGIHITQDSNRLADAVISGRGVDLFNVALAKGQSHSLFKYGIEITGDTHLAEKIRDIFFHIDIDWEAHLSRCIGETLAQPVSRSVQKALTVGRRLFETLRQNTEEYLQIEAKQLPTQAAVSKFIHEVDLLRHAVDRLEARLNLLREKRNFAS